MTTVRGRRVQAQAVRGNDMKFTSFISDFAMATATARRAEMTLTRPDTGDALPMEVVSGKIRNERDEAVAIVSVLHDLTKQYENARLYEELKRSSEGLEARIRAATADLAEQNAKLQWQTQEVERANTLKSEFLASMSHELRTPINAVLGHTANMIEGIYGVVSEDQLEMLKRIRSAANHLLALINDILDLARIEAGKMPLRIEYVHLKSIVTEISQQIEPLVRRKGLDYVTEVPPDCPPLRTDRTKVKQVLLNLLSNAIKFTPRGVITLRAECDDDSVKHKVTDTGIGIKAKDLGVIWEDFRQVDQTLIREYGGTGLGLSIVAQAARSARRSRRGVERVWQRHDVYGDVAVACRGRGPHRHAGRYGCPLASPRDPGLRWPSARLVRAAPARPRHPLASRRSAPGSRRPRA